MAQRPFFLFLFLKRERRDRVVAIEGFHEVNGNRVRYSIKLGCLKEGIILGSKLQSGLGINNGRGPSTGGMVTIASIVSNIKEGFVIGNIRELIMKADYLMDPSAERGVGLPTTGPVIPFGWVIVGSDVDLGRH